MKKGQQNGRPWVLMLGPWVIGKLCIDSEAVHSDSLRVLFRPHPETFVSLSADDSSILAD